MEKHLEKVGGWILSYDKRRDGSKKIKAATDVGGKTHLYSTEEGESLENLYESGYASKEEEIEERNLSQEGLETLEQNIRDENVEKMLTDGEGQTNSVDRSKLAAQRKKELLDHRKSPDHFN